MILIFAPVVELSLVTAILDVPTMSCEEIGFGMGPNGQAGSNSHPRDGTLSPN